MTQNLVSEDQAREEVAQWMEVKRVPLIKRSNEIYKDAQEALMYGMMEGYLTFDQDSGQLTQKLRYPLEFKTSNGDSTSEISSLTYKNRVKEIDITNRMKGIKADDGMGIMRANIAAATSQSMDIIQKLDNDDMSLARSVATFFI